MSSDAAPATSLLDAAVRATADDPVDVPDAVVTVVVTGPGRTETSANFSCLAGRVAATTDGGAAVTFTVGREDGLALAAGALAPTEAFMRARLKTAGDPGLVLRLLAAADGGAWARWVRELELPATR